MKYIIQFTAREEVEATYTIEVSEPEFVNFCNNDKFQKNDFLNYNIHRADIKETTILERDIGDIAVMIQHNEDGLKALAREVVHKKKTADLNATPSTTAAAAAMMQAFALATQTEVNSDEFKQLLEKYSGESYPYPNRPDAEAV